MNELAGKRVALYARVSTQEQNLDNQVIVLKEWAKHSGIKNYQLFKEKESTRKTRPVKEKVKALARQGKINAIVCTSLDRWSRSVSELIMEVDEFSRRGVVLTFIREGIDFNTAAGRLYMHVVSAMAEFERALNRERTLAGLARARAQGKKLGRPRKKKVKKR